MQRLWVDALCINQMDHPEKYQQIEHMDKIYSFASVVIIWLGDSRDDSDYVMRTISHRNEQDYVEKRFLVGLIAILYREWFTRTWIVQEFVLNRTEPLLACGLQEMVP